MEQSNSSLNNEDVKQIMTPDVKNLLNELDKKNLSKELEITAETKDGLIMGIQHKKYNIHGVQFHPESIKTKIGIKILKNFIKIND